MSKLDKPIKIISRRYPEERAQTVDEESEYLWILQDFAFPKEIWKKKDEPEALESIKKIKRGCLSEHELINSSLITINKLVDRVNLIIKYLQIKEKK